MSPFAKVSVRLRTDVFVNNDANDDDADFSTVLSASKYCHTGADRGDFDDDNIRMPAGVNLGQRWFWKD